jgi:REP element-mobilizing transposase RayT
MARGNNKQAIFHSPKDYNSFLSMLRVTKQRYHFKLYAYALMPNHIHLFLEVGQKPSARIMQSLLTSYAQYFNREYERTGHLFQGRYKAVLCEKDSYAMWLLRYIHLNPIRANIAKELNQWKWTSHGEYCGKTKKDLIDNGVVAELFGSGSTGASNYMAYISEGMAQASKYDESLHPSEAAPFLGSDSFKEEMERNLHQPHEKNRKNLREIITEEIKGSGVHIDAVFGKSRKTEISTIRKSVIKKAIMEYGYIASELAKQLNCSEAYISIVVKQVT